MTKLNACVVRRMSVVIFMAIKGSVDLSGYVFGGGRYTGAKINLPDRDWETHTHLVLSLIANSVH